MTTQTNCYLTFFALKDLKASQSSSSDYPHSTSSEDDPCNGDTQSAGSHTSDEPGDMLKEDNNEIQARFHTREDKRKI